MPRRFAPNFKARSRPRRSSSRKTASDAIPHRMGHNLTIEIWQRRDGVLGRLLILFLHTLSAISKYRQNAFAIFICSGVLHSGSNNAGEHTKIDRHFAREVATFNRFNEYRKFIPRG